MRVNQPTEDWAGATPTAVVVLDGLISPPDLDSGCIHGVPWYVNRLGPALLRKFLLDEDHPTPVDRRHVITR